MRKDETTSAPFIWLSRSCFTIAAVLLFFACGAFAATNSYDPLNRLTSVVYSPTQRIDYVYDAAGNLIEERVNGSAGLMVTAQASPVAGGTVSILPAQSGYVAGDVVTVTTTPAAGYTFTGWSGVPGCSLAASCTFTLGSTNIAAFANFTVPSNLQPLRVIPIPAIGGTVAPTPNAVGYAPGTALSFTATPASGYVIDYWNGAGCTNFSGATCNFSMPAVPTDQYVSFKQAGSGYALTTIMSAYSGSSINALAAGVIEVIPSKKSFAAGEFVSIKFHVGKGYRFGVSAVQVNGVNDTTGLCQVFYANPGEEPVCSFAMPAGAVDITGYYAPDPKRYLIDASVSPVDGGSVGFSFTSTLPSYMVANWFPETGGNINRQTAAAGTTVILTAVPVSARPFLKWQNGPCTNSTNPVCSFTMPAADVITNPQFGDSPDASCTYAVTPPSMVFPGTGGNATVNVVTQAGCNFNASVVMTNGVSDVTTSVAGTTITLIVPAHPGNYGRGGALRIDAGRQFFTLPIMQAGNSSNSGAIYRVPPTSMGTVGAGDVPVNATTITFPNTSGVAQVLNSVVTVGPYAIRSHSCSGTLAIGASCSANIEFVPRVAGAAPGEVMLAANNLVWSATLTGNVLPTRENVAAIVSGGVAHASSVYDVVSYSENFAVNSDRRMNSEPRTWLTRTYTPQQYLDVVFSRARPVEWVYVFGFNSGPSPAQISEPATTSLDGNTSNTDGYTVQYWTGTSWAAVNELARVDGNFTWKRVNFAPVTTDRLRVLFRANITGPQILVSEIEAWTVSSDVVPDAFAFAPEIGVPQSTAVQSAAATPTGFNTSVSLSVTGGTYSIGCNGVFASAATTLSPGQSVCVRHTSAATAATSVNTTLTVGGVAGTFTSTTASAPAVATDVTPDPIASQTINGVSRNSYVYFAPFTVTGINSPANLGTYSSTATSLEVSVGCTNVYDRGIAFPGVRLFGSVSNGQLICSRHISATSGLSAAMSELQLGTLLVQLNSVTAALSCSLDIDGANGVSAAVDGVIINRYLLGVRGDALVAGLTPIGARNTGALVTPILGSGTQFDVLGRAVPAPTATVDGLILIRLMLGVPDTALLNGIAIPAGVTFGNAAAIRGNVNTMCGTGY